MGCTAEICDNHASNYVAYEKYEDIPCRFCGIRHAMSHGDLGAIGRIISNTPKDERKKLANDVLILASKVLKLCVFSGINSNNFRNTAFSRESVSPLHMVAVSSSSPEK